MTRPPAWLCLLKISKVPWWFFWVSPVVLGYLAAGRSAGAEVGHPAWLAAIVVGTCLIEAAGCLHNELVDKDEDAVNQPERRMLLGALDERLMWRLVLGVYGVCAVGLVVLAVDLGWPLAVIMAVGGSAVPLYNWGPHFKLKPYVAPWTIGAAAAVAVVTGWRLGGGTVDAFPVAAVLLYAIVVVCSEYKGEPAVLTLDSGSGHEAVNDYYAVAFPDATPRRDRGRAFVTRHISYAPYLLLVVLVAAAALPPPFLVLLVLVPVNAVIYRVGSRAADTAEMIVAHEVGFAYGFALCLGVLALTAGGALAAVVAACLLLARLGAVGLGLAPRFVAPAFPWGATVRRLLRATRPRAT